MKIIMNNPIHSNDPPKEAKRKPRRETDRPVPRRMRNQGLPELQVTPSQRAIAFGISFFMAFFPFESTVLAVLPTGPEIIHGDVNIGSDGIVMAIDQSTEAAIINWQGFSIGLDNAVNVNQPDAFATMLSRVIGNDVSDILGSLTATGHFYLVNPNGIFFGPDATIDTNALIASTLDISDSDFLAGSNIFAGESEASIINESIISADDFVTLIAKYVENIGTIEVKGGSVGIAARETVLQLDSVYGGGITIDISGISGDAINSGVIDVSAENTDGDGGAIIMEGDRVGQFGMAVSDADGKGRGGYIEFNADTAVSLSGESVTSANADSEGDGGTVIAYSEGSAFFRPGASIEVKGGSEAGDGGFAEMSGIQHVEIHGRVDATAPAGEVGEFLIDPGDVDVGDFGNNTNIDEVGDDFQPSSGAASGNLDVEELKANLQTASVTVSTTNNGVDGGATGIITISAGINDAGSAGNTRTLTFDADDEIRIASPITAVATGVLNIIFDAINFVRHQAGSNITTNGGNVTYLPPVVFQANALVNTDNPGAVAGNVNFQDTVSGNFNLSLSANGSTNGNIDFDGVVSNIGNLAITFANNVTFDDALDADVITVALVTGALQFDGAVTANASFNVTAENINVNDDLTTADGVGASLTSGAAGTTAVSAATTIDIGSTGTGGTTGSLTFGGGTLQTAGDVTAAEDINVNIPAELTGNASFTAAGGNLSFNNTVNDDGAGGADNLNVSATGTIQFGDTLGGTDRLGTLAIDTSGSTVNPTSVTFTNPVTATSITRDGGTGTNTFVSTVNVNNGAGIGIDLDGADFTFQDTVTDTSTGGVRITNTSTLDVSGSFNLSGGPFVQDGAGLSDVGTDISTTNDGISFDGSVTFSSASNLSSGGAGIDIGDSTADMVTVNALTTVDTDNATVNVNGNLSLGANLSIDSVNGVNGGAVNFVGTVDGGNFLTVDLADGTATFSDVVGGGATVDGIAIISAGQVDFNNTLRVGTQNVDINAATVNFNDAVTTVTNGTVTITNTGTLTIQNDADFNLDGAFLQDGAGGVSLGAVDDASGLSISTTNDLVQFDGPVGLLANTTVDAGSGGITINGFLDGNFGVVLNTSGTTILAGVIGGGTPIASITTDDGVGLDVTEIRANISGQGTTMTFNDNVELTGGSVTLTDTGGTVVSFGGTVNGAQDLTLAVSGTTTFSSAVGDSTPLGDGGGAAITLDSTGPTNFDSTVATASGIAQADTAGAVTFDQNVDIVGGDTNTTFDANVVLDGLTFTSDGTIIFGNGVGGDTLTISSALVTVDTSTPGSLVDLNAATTLNAGLTVTTGAAGITLDGTIQGANDLTLNTSGTTDINAEIGGGGSPIASITTDLAGLGTTEVSADITASGGTMTFNDPVVLTGATTFTDTGGIGVSFNSTVNGGNDLTLAVDGSTTFADTVGNSAPIGAGPGAGITINSAGTTDFQNTVATASGFDQADAAGAISFLTDVNVGAGGTANTFNADVVLDGLTFTTAVDLTFGSDSLDNLTLSTGSVTLDAGGNNITLNSETDGNQPFVLNSTVTTDINGAIGASTPVSTLTTNAGGTTDLGADISTQGGTITFGDPVVLSADITLTDTGTTGVTFSDTISGAQILNILATTATVQFDGNVGAPTRLNNLDVDADTINVNAGIDAVTVSLSTDNVALSGGAGSITGNDGGTLSIAPLTDARTIGIGNLSTGLLNIDSSEIATIADNGFTSLTFGSLTGSGAVDVEAVTFNDPVTIQSPGGAIGIQGALTGDDEATVTVDGGTIDVDAAVTTTDAPGGGGAITLSAESGLNVDGNVITVNSAAIVLDGDASDDGTGDLLVSQAVGVVITGDAGSGNVDLEGENVTLGDGGANNVAVFGNTINVLADKDDSLVTPGGDFTLNAGSSINALDALTIGTPGNTAQNVIISGTLDAANGLTVRADDALTVNANITTTNNSAITLDADSDDSGVGDLTIASTADVAVDSVEGNMTLEGENITLGGAFNATITGGNTKITANKFGAGTGDFTLNDGSSITANLTVGDATVDVDDPFDVTVSGTMTSDGAITFSAENDITVTASADVSSTSSSVTFTSDTDNNGNATISVAPLTTGDITGSTVTFTSGSGANNDVTLNDIINNTSGGITFGDNLDEVNLNTDLSSDGRIDFGATIVNLALVTVINADVSALDAANDVDLGSADLVGGANDLNLDAGTGDVFLGTLSTTGNLVIDDADNLELTGGGGTGIVSIVNAFSDGGLLANLPAGDVIRVSGNATVNTNTNLIDLVTGNIRAINGAAPGGTLTLSSGGSNITLHQVGQATAVGGLTADAGGAAITLMADIRTTGTQDYRNGDVDIDAGVDLLANVSGNILMNTGVTSIEFTDAAAGTNTINAAGSVNFGTTLTDSLAGPATVTVDAGNNITVSGATFDGASITTLDLDVGNTGAGTLFFQTAAVTVDSIDVDGTGADDAVDIDQNLTSTNAAGTGIDIAGVSTVDVAEITDLISDNVLNINAPGGINLSGGNGTTNLFDSDNDVALTLTGPVTAGNNVNLTLDSEGAITVNSAVDINLGTFIMNVDVNDDGVVIGQLGGDVDAGVVTIIQTAVAPNDTLDVDGSITAATGVVAIQNFDIVDIAANQSVQSTNDSVTIDHSAATTATRVTFNDGASASAGTTLDVNNTALLELGSSASITANNGELDLRTGVTVTNLTGAAGPANAVLLDGNGADNNVLISDVDSATANEADLTVNSDGNFDFWGVAGNVDLSAGVGTGGTLTVNVDVNNNGSIILDMTVGTFDLGGLSVSGTSGNDDFDLAVLTTQNPAADVDVDDFLTADFSGNLTSAGGINLTNIPNVNILTGVPDTDITFDAQGVI